jgi:hypothetical protein
VVYKSDVRLAADSLDINIRTQYLPVTASHFKPCTFLVHMACHFKLFYIQCHLARHRFLRASLPPSYPGSLLRSGISGHPVQKLSGREAIRLDPEQEGCMHVLQ